VHRRTRVPHRAEAAVGAVVLVAVLAADVRDAIGFSSFCVLVYYAIANASALTLRVSPVPVLGLTGCVVLAATLPPASALAGVGVLAAGLLAYASRR
jgi:APA family basic amino acid/polyamine antiporter